METLYNITTEALHISKGNSKLGNIWNINFIPGNEEHRPVNQIHDKSDYSKIIDKKYTTNVIGTCSKHCSQCANQTCYAFAALVRYHNRCVKSWSENTNMLRSGKLFEAIQAEFNSAKGTKDECKIFRINDSGELENLDQFVEWNILAAKNQDITFSLYTKNYEVIDEFMTGKNRMAPNLIINISQWNHEADDFLKKYDGVFNVFEFDGSNRRNHNFSEEDVERMSKLVHCPAVSKEGKRTGVKCDQCQRCYRKTGQTTCVYAH